jgi:hypothetical protein
MSKPNPEQKAREVIDSIVVASVLGKLQRATCLRQAIPKKAFIGRLTHD